MSDQIAKLLNDAFGEEIPGDAQLKLDDLYAKLGEIPQSVVRETCSSHSSATENFFAAKAGVPNDSAYAAAGNGVGKPFKRFRGQHYRAAAVLAAAVAVALALGGAAYAGARLLDIGPGDVPFFQGANLPVYDSMEQGTPSMSAKVGQTTQADGVRVTLDSVSCDRNVANVYLTLERDGGFSMDALSLYEGSQENEWSRLQRLVPLFRFTALGNGTVLCEGDVRVLDAYTDENGAVKCLLRLVPEEILPDQVELQLHAESPWTQGGALRTGEEDQAPSIDFSVGLDLSGVENPCGFGQRTLEFQTSEGVKKLPIKRFSVSELGCVLVASNESAVVEGTEADEDVAPMAMNLNLIKLSDNLGNVLHPVDAGDGRAVSAEQAVIVEYGGVDRNATDVTFTPFTRVGAESFEYKNTQIDADHVGVKLATSEYGGYELTGCDVADGTVSIALKPYGVTFGYVPELNTTELPTVLETRSTDFGGEEDAGRHVGIRWQKWDYATGDVLQMTSYYAASDEELRSMTAYGYVSLFATFSEEGDAALTCSLR